MSLGMPDAVSSVLASALDGLATRQNVIADNIANVDTPGFRATRVGPQPPRTRERPPNTSYPTPGARRREGALARASCDPVGPGLRSRQRREFGLLPRDR